MLTKRRDWEPRLVSYLQSQIGKPFEWATRDCTSVIIEAIEAMLGTDFPAPELAYNTRNQALVFKKRHPSLFQLIKKHCETVPVPVGFEQRGDILFLSRQGFQCAHIVLDRKLLSVDFEHGVQLGQMRDMPPHRRGIRIL